MSEISCTYICPLRSATVDMATIREFNEYWKALSAMNCEVLVVDGSPPDVFKVHEREWSHCRHIKVDPKHTYLNGKVNGILTAVPQASHEKIILADDDVRYIKADIDKMVEDLEEFDLARPQNYFYPLPWWAKVDSARILINRSLYPEGAFPGTFGFSKSIFLAAGAFDGDVLFDNEELVKHLQNHGARIKYSKDFFIQRQPPTFEKWMEQRPRQAYEDFVMKKKTMLFLSLVPLHILLGLSGKRKSLGILTLTVSAIAIGKAFKGRNRKSRRYLPAETPLYAPLWVLERSISVYLALYWKLVKGGYPFGDKVIKKGTGEAWQKEKLFELKQKKYSNILQQ